MFKVDKESITQAALRELLDYNRETGEFTWIKARSGIRVGQVAGNVGNRGYIQIRVNGNLYQAHRLVWLYVYGYFPEGDKPFIDHINRNRVDNRIENLRACTNTENIRNTAGYAGSKTHSKGVEKLPSGRFRSRIKNPSTKKLENLGVYLNEEEASAVYEVKAREYYAEFYQGYI